MQLEGFDDFDDVEMDIEVTGSGQLTIDGEECYWIEWEESHVDGYKSWSKRLIIPQYNENQHTDIYISAEKENKKAADKYYRKIVEKMKFSDGNAVKGGNSTISRFGITIPGEDMELDLCTYDDWDERLEQIAFLLDTYEYEDGLDKTFGEIKGEEDENGKLLDSGELEIDGVKGKWCSFSYYDAYEDGEDGGHYFLVFPNDSTGQMVVVRFSYYGDIDQHSKEIEVVTDSIHFTK